MHLLNLPPEVRITIWKLVVVEPHFVDAGRRLGFKGIKDRKLNKDGHFAPSKLAIAFTCRQIYAEATELYYSLNRFHLSCPTAHSIHPYMFFRAIGPRNRAYVKDVAFTARDEKDLKNFRSYPVSLEYLQISVETRVGNLDGLKKCAKRGQWKLQLQIWESEDCGCSGRRRCDFCHNFEKLGCLETEAIGQLWVRVEEGRL